MTISKDELLSGLFGNSTAFENQTDIRLIDINLIDDLSSFTHPFEKSLHSNKGINELAEQIRIDGVLQPVLLRPKEDGRYEVLAGHRRKRASKIAGLSAIPACIKICDDDTAKLIVTHTNLGQRDEILASEKAKAYKMELDAIKRVAGRPKFNSAPVGQNLSDNNIDTQSGKFSVDIVAENASESRQQIQRYIRLNELINELLDRVDNKEISLRAAVEVSYLKPYEQTYIENILQMDKNINLSADIAAVLREQSTQSTLTYDDIEAIMRPTDRKKDNNGDKLPRPAKPVYKDAFKGLEKQFKMLPSEQAEKLALCDRETLEEVISKAVLNYLDEMIY